MLATGNGLTIGCGQRAGSDSERAAGLSCGGALAELALSIVEEVVCMRQVRSKLL